MAQTKKSQIIPANLMTERNLSIFLAVILLVCVALLLFKAERNRAQVIEPVIIEVSD